MHLHAGTLDPGPPTAGCTPFDPPAPLWDQRRLLLYAHPQVYVDVAAIVWHMPREGFRRSSRRSWTRASPSA
jgi:hypothetical protein